MQKARRHPTKGGLRPLVGARFQVLFHSPARGPFHLSLTVLSAIGLSGVFSLAGWCRPIRTGFLRSRLTQGPASLPSPFAYRPLTFSGAPFQALPLGSGLLLSRPYYPAGASTPAVWAPPLSLATTRGITLVLFSCRYLDVSVRGVRPAIAVRGLQPRGFPHSDIRGSQAICASPRLFAACHVLPRLREPQASPVRPSRFPFHIPVSRRGCSCSLFPVSSMNSPGVHALRLRKTLSPKKDRRNFPPYLQQLKTFYGLYRSSNPWVPKRECKSTTNFIISKSSY